MDIDKLKKAYESALTHYNLPDFETFMKDMEDEEKQAKFLESLAKHYSVPDLETFQSDMGLKKKDDSQIVSTAVTDSSEVSESEIRSILKNETAFVDDQNPPTNEDKNLLELDLDPHSMALSAAGIEDNIPEEEFNVLELPPVQQENYSRAYNRFNQERERQEDLLETQKVKENNLNLYGVSTEDEYLPGVIPSLKDKTTFNIKPGSYNYSEDPEVINEAKIILETQIPKAARTMQDIFKNPSVYGYDLPEDITLATDKQIKEAKARFIKINKKSETGAFVVESMPGTDGTATFKTKIDNYIDLDESYLLKMFDEQVTLAKQNSQDQADPQIREAKNEEIKSRQDNGELSDEDVRNINLLEQKQYDYDNNMSKSQKKYINATNKLNEIEDKQSLEYKNALIELAEARVGLGKDRENAQLFDIETGARVDKIMSPNHVDLSSYIKQAEEKTKTFKGTVEEGYIDSSNREEDHRIFGNESRRDIEVKDPSYWRLKGFEVEKLENGNFKIKNVSLKQASYNTDAIQNESVKLEAEQWKEKNYKNIASRKVWAEMSLLNIDPGKVDKSKFARFFEVIGDETFGEEFTSVFGMSDRKFIDKAITELENDGIELTDAQKENFERTFGEELTESTAGFLPILGKMYLGNKVLGAVGAAGWLNKTIQVLNQGKKFDKFKGFLLGATAEEAKMQAYGFEKGAGFGFHLFGKVVPAGQVFKMKGEFARLNNLANATFEQGLKGTGALEFATHVEAIIRDMEGNDTYQNFLQENYPDVSTVGRRVLLNAATFSIFGAGGVVLAGKGRSGMNIKNMETTVKELREKGYNQEAEVIQKQVDLYYSGKEKASPKEKEILDRHEKGEVDFDVKKTENKDTKQLVIDFGGKEVKSKKETKQEVETKVEAETKAPDLKELEKKAVEALNKKEAETKVEPKVETAAKEKKTQETTGKEVKAELEVKTEPKETYKPAEITNVKDPVSVLNQAKERQKQSGLEFKRRLDNKELSDKQKQTFREEATQIQKDIKTLEKLIVEKGFEKKETQETKSIQEFSDRVVKGLESAKQRLEKEGMTYSLIVPVPPKVLSKALDVGIAAIKGGAKVAIGLNKFRNYIIKELRKQGPIKKSQLEKLNKQLDDIFTRSYGLTDKNVLDFAKETAKQKRLDIDGFVKDLKSNPNFSKYTKQELQQLYRNSIKDLTPKEKEAFTEKAAKETKQTKSSVKKDIKSIEQISPEAKPETQQTRDVINNIKEKIKQFERGVTSGKKQKKKDVKKTIKEFNDFLNENTSELGRALRATIRAAGKISDKSTLNAAIERVNKIISDKKTVSELIERQNIKKKILKISDVVQRKGKKDVAKQSVKATGGEAAADVSRLNRINKHIKKADKDSKYEIEKHEIIQEKLEQINDIHQNTQRAKNQKELDKLFEELQELQYSQLNNKTTAQLNELLKDAQEIYNTAKTKREVQRQKDAERFSKIREEAILVISNNKPLSRGSQFLKKGRKQRQDFLDLVEDKSLQTVLKSLNVFTKGKNGNWFLENIYKKHVKKSEDAEIMEFKRYTKEWTDKVAKIFNVKPEVLDIKLQEMRMEKKTGITIESMDATTGIIYKDVLQISEMQALSKWMESKDLANKSNLENMGFDKKNLEKLDKFLSPEAKKFGEYLFSEYRKSYDRYNETYKKMFGVDMPSAGKFYSPRFIEGKENKNQDLNANDILTSSYNNVIRTANNTHLSRRIENSEPLLFHDASLTFWKYRQSMERFHHYSNTVRELNAVFGDARVRKYIEQYHGTAYTKVLDYYMDVMSGNFKNKMDIGLGDAVNNLTGGILFLKPAIGIKQTFSTIMYGTQMPMAKFLPGLLKFGQGGIVDIKSGAFWQSRDKAYYDNARSLAPRNAYSKTRLRKGIEKLGARYGMTKVTDRAILAGVTFSNFMRRYMNPVNSLFIRWGDKIGIGWGGQVYADYQYKQYKKQGLSDKVARKKALADFEIFAEASQQSSRASNVSYIRGMGGDLAKPFTMFTSSMVQINQIAAQAARELARGKNKRQNAKIIAVAHFGLGAVFTLAGNSFKWDDDKMKWGMIVGNSEGVFGLGKLISTLKNSQLGDKGFKSGLSPLIDEIKRASDYYVKIDESVEKMEELRFSTTSNLSPKQKLKRYRELKEQIKENRTKLGLTLAQLTGVPARGALGIYEDVGAIIRNESDNPIREILGFENDWTVGRELWDIPEKGFMNPTEEDRKLHQLKREQKKIAKKYKTADETEQKQLIDDYKENYKKIKRLMEKKNK